LKPERLAGPVDLSNHPTLLPPMPRKSQATGTVAQMTGLGSDIVPTPASEPVARQSVAPSLSGPAPILPQPLSPFVASSSHGVSGPSTSSTAQHPVVSLDPSAPRPVYSIAARPPRHAATQSEADADKDIDEEGSDNLDDLRIHVVHNGDTLQRLAKRYLDDERRALEIFDLNRETLSNPHLLPIGTEIVIPPKVISPIDALQVN